MNQYVAELPWTDEQWNRVHRTVVEEAQRTRVAAKFLQIYGPVDKDEVAVPSLWLNTGAVAPLAPAPPPPPAPPGPIANLRLAVGSLPNTVLATISSLVYVRNHEAADPELQAALTMFRRAANFVARVEDGLMFNGQGAVNMMPFLGPLARVPAVCQVHGGALQDGLLGPAPNALPGSPFVGAGPNPFPPGAFAGRALGVQRTAALPPGGPGPIGIALVGDIVMATNALEAGGYGPPYACILALDLYQAVHTPTNNLVLPRDTIMPVLGDGPLLRSSLLQPGWGLIVPCESGQIEQVLATDICVKLLQVSEEPRFVFRVSERLALRVKDWNAVVNIFP